MYNIIVKKCDDPEKVHAVAEELARWSGMKTDAIVKIITENPVCVKRNTTGKDALNIKKRFESSGACVEMVMVKERVASINDDESDEPGRVLTELEFIEKLNSRDDIFILEEDTRLRKFEAVSLIVGIGCGIFLSTYKITTVLPDFIENVLPQTSISMRKEPVVNVTRPPVEQSQFDKKHDSRKVLKRSNEQGSGAKGGGDPKARVTAKGVLGIISGQIKGNSVASADMFAEGGFSSSIDAVLSGVGGLKTGASGGVGRKGVAAIGFGTGYNSGFGGGSGGDIGDLLGNISEGTAIEMKLKKLPVTIGTVAEHLKGQAFVGGRNKTEIMRVVMQNIRALRYVYNKRLRENPGLSGRVTVKFGIDELGRVLFASVVESTLGDSEFEVSIVDKVRRWVFAKIDKPGDITEVVYPFVFAQ